MGILDQFFKKPADLTPLPGATAPVIPVVDPNNPTPPVIPAKVDPVISKTTTGDPTNIDPTTGKPPVSGVPPVVPTVDPNNPNSPRTPPNPLDVYTKLFDNANKDKTNEPPKFDIPMETLDEVAKGLDFTVGIDPELLKNALEKGDSASFMKVIESTSRNAYKTAIQHANKLTEHQLGARSTYEATKVDASVKQGLIQNSLASTHNYDHPVVKRELNRIANELAVQYPDKTHQQIADSAKEYFDTFLEAIKDPAKALPGAGKNPDGSEKIFDWTDYLTAKPNTQQ